MIEGNWKWYRGYQRVSHEFRARYRIPFAQHLQELAAVFVFLEVVLQANIRHTVTDGLGVDTIK